jgi:hypothetical protein
VSRGAWAPLSVRAEKWLYRWGLRDARGLTLPDFLGIGAVKAGTTWLHRNLLRHPGLFLPVQKPVRYFDLHYHRPLADYARVFLHAGGRVKGEISAAYSTLPADRIRLIRRIMPDLKLVLLLRRPDDRAWSDARMELTVFRGRPPESLTEEELCAELRSPRSRARGDYRRILDAWLAEFPRERLFVGVLEEFGARPEPFLRRLFRFLGVAEDVPLDAFPLRERIFRGPDVPMPARCRSLLDELYAGLDHSYLSPYAGFDVAALWRKEGR